MVHQYYILIYNIYIFFFIYEKFSFSILHYNSFSEKMNEKLSNFLTKEIFSISESRRMYSGNVFFQTALIFRSVITKLATFLRLFSTLNS